MTCLRGCCEKILVADDGCSKFTGLFFFCQLKWVGLRFVYIDSDSGESQSLSCIDFSLFVYSFPVYLPEGSYLKSQSLSSFLPCKRRGGKKPTHIHTKNKPPFSSLLIKEMQSEREQTAVPWNFLLSGQLTIPYSSTRLSKCHPFSCADSWGT